MRSVGGWRKDSVAKTCQYWGKTHRHLMLIMMRTKMMKIQIENVRFTMNEVSDVVMFELSGVSLMLY